MTKQEAIHYIESQGWSNASVGIERIRALLKRLGEPQRQLRYVHVAGSNGKGSTCAMLESILRAAGYHTGLCISPHIQDFCERFQIDGQPLPEETFVPLAERVIAASLEMDERPNCFEMINAIAFLAFAEAGCEIVVLEVGMGGALDSTNVIDCPEVAVFTNIGLEHTEYLGSTIEEIAATKAGILKPGCRCVCYDGPMAQKTVIASACARMGIPLRFADVSKVTLVESSLERQRFLYGDREYALSLIGPHQRANAATVLEVVFALREEGWSIPDPAVKEGLQGARWPARMELLRSEPPFLLDGGHNPQCAQALAESLQELFPGQKAVFLVGMLKSKAYRDTMERLLPFASSFLCVQPNTPRALPAKELCDCLVGLGAKATVAGSVAEGIRQARALSKEVGLAVAFGSLSWAAEVRSAFPSKTV